MIVVVIIGLLAAMALPTFKIVRERSLASRTANDFRQFATAFQNYSLENGVWPSATTTEGEVPTEMTGLLPVAWTQSNPQSGGYLWSGDTGRIVLTNTNASESVMQRVDSVLDDGNLSTGDFRSTSTTSYYWQLH
jgi:type II secretory pathway pseudopilin PulG